MGTPFQFTLNCAVIFATREVYQSKAILRPLIHSPSRLVHSTCYYYLTVALEKATLNTRRDASTASIILFEKQSSDAFCGIVGSHKFEREELTGLEFDTITILFVMYNMRKYHYIRRIEATSHLLSPHRLTKWHPRETPSPNEG